MSLVVYMHAKFDVSSFTPFPRYGGGTKISKVGHKIPSLPLWPNLAFLWIALVVNLSVKFDGNILIGDRYMAILLLCRFGCEMLIPAHFGSLTPKCSQISPRPQKGWTHAFWHTDRPNRSRNVTWARAKESKKKEKRKKRNSEMWQVTYVPRPPMLHYSHQSCHVGWGPRHSQPCQVSSKLVRWLRLPYGSKSAIFLCLALWFV